MSQRGKLEMSILIKWFSKMSLNILDQLLINGAECNFVILKMTMIGF